jgi:NADPH-dependent 7-cyano-7-deazaguanine reductase QueF
MTKETWNVVADIIEQSNFFYRYGKKEHWTSDHSTLVYPITHTPDMKEIEIQLRGTDNRGITSSAKRLAKILSSYIRIKHIHFCKWDGSCPDTYRFIYE